METITAETVQSVGALDITNKQIAAAVLIRSFRFEKALMQEHFNENYMESGKFPKATFAGKFQEEVGNLAQGASLTLTVTGDITIHGITKAIKFPVTLSRNSNKLQAAGTFNVKLDDFGIKIPTVVKDNISKDVAISYQFQFNLPN